MVEHENKVQNIDSEGLIPVEAPNPGHSPVSPATGSESILPASEGTDTLVSTVPEKAPVHSDHNAPIPISTDTPPQYPVNPPSYAKAYPGQPSPLLAQQPNTYYTPSGHPSGYATATPLHSVQSAPCVVDCPNCGKRQMTRTEAFSGNTTHCWAALICFCCCLGCIPYLMTSTKDIDHYCGECNMRLATYHNSGRVEVARNAQGLSEAK